MHQAQQAYITGAHIIRLLIMVSGCLTRYASPSPCMASAVSQPAVALTAWIEHYIRHDGPEGMTNITHWWSPDDDLDSLGRPSHVLKMLRRVHASTTATSWCCTTGSMSHTYCSSLGQHSNRRRQLTHAQVGWSQATMITCASSGQAQRQHRNEHHTSRHACCRADPPGQPQLIHRMSHWCR